MTDPTPEDSAEEEKQDDDGGVSRYLWIGAAALAVPVILVFLAGIGLAFLTDAQQTAPRMAIIRDSLIIIMVLEGILIVVALAVLVIQMIRLSVMLRDESLSILNNAQETVETAKGTAQFMSKNLVRPVIDFQTFATMVTRFIRETTRIRRAIRPAQDDKSLSE